MSVETGPATKVVPDAHPAAAAERSTLLRSLARDVSKIATLAPPGLGRSNRTWEIVDGPTADLMAALSAWEADPVVWETDPESGRTKESARAESVRVRYGAVLHAWLRAVAAHWRESLGLPAEGTR